MFAFIKNIKNKKRYWEFNYDEPGFNFRMPALNAALGISQINKLNEILKNKKKFISNIKNILKI